MRAKPTLVARVNDGSGKFPRVPAEIVKNKIKIPKKVLGRSFELGDIIGFYARHSPDAKRRLVRAATPPGT